MTNPPAERVALLPCPFCGGEPRTQPHWLEETWSAACSACGAVLPYVGLNEEEAATAWNTRAAISSMPAHAPSVHGNCILGDECGNLASLTRKDGSEGVDWQPIETAPKDGTVIDVWREGRETVFWGFPPHECGEAGSYCDSDWHGIKKPGWVCSTFGEFVGCDHDPFTHWRPLPAPPAALKEGASREG